LVRERDIEPVDDLFSDFVAVDCQENRIAKEIREYQAIQMAYTEQQSLGCFRQDRGPEWRRPREHSDVQGLPQPAEVPWLHLEHGAPQVL